MWHLARLALDVVEKKSTPNSNGFDNFDRRYSNLYLNENYKCSNISSLVQSDSKLKKHDETFAVSTDNFEKWKNLQPKIVEHCSKNLMPASKYDEAEEKVKNRWKKESSSATSSTLSLHIAASENPVEAFTNAHDKNERFKKKCLVEKRENVKQIFTESLQSLFQNPFEFPRQQKEGQVDDPEVMQFKASQRLLNPNQSTSPTSFPQSSPVIAMFLEGLIAIIYVYLIGFIYSLKEFWKDRSEPITVEEVEKKSKSFNQSSEKVAVITGGDGQIGKELVKYLLKLGYIVCSVGFKNPIVSDNVKHYATDLSEKDQVIDAAKQICAGFPKGIHLVICNAGIMLHPFRLSETEHIEMHLAVNVLGHAILVENLQPVLKQLKNRVIFVSSATCRAGYFSKSANIKGFWQRKLNGYQAYANSKLLLSIFAEKLVEEEREKFPKTTFLSVHPGVVPGRLYRYTNLPFQFLINSFMAPYLRKNKTAALRVLDLAFTSSVQNGGYYEDGIHISVTSKIKPLVRQNLYSLIIKEIENQGFYDSNESAEISDMEIID